MFLIVVVIINPLLYCKYTTDISFLQIYEHLFVLNDVNLLDFALSNFNKARDKAFVVYINNITNKQYNQ